MVKLTEAEFDVLKRQRDTAIEAAVKALCAERGWDFSEAQVHISGGSTCYCACPNGPCQHEFSGWREFEDNSGGETFCSRCGTGAMAHGMRTAE